MKKIKEKEESELEEELEQGLDEIVIEEIAKDAVNEIEFPEEETGRINFQQFMGSSSTNPSLEKISSFQQMPETNFEQEFLQQRTEERDNMDEIKKYDVVGEEARRIYEIRTQRSGSSSIEPQMLRTTDNLSRTQFLDPLAGRRFNSDNIEPDVIETGEMNRNRKLPFEERERKYREVKL